jgi:hypothetical protein
MTKLDTIKSAVADLSRRDLELLRAWLDGAAATTIGRVSFTDAERAAWLDESRAGIDAYNSLLDSGHVLLSEEEPLF